MHVCRAHLTSKHKSIGKGQVDFCVTLKYLQVFLHKDNFQLYVKHIILPIAKILDKFGETMCLYGNCAYKGADKQFKNLYSRTKTIFLIMYV